MGSDWKRVVISDVCELIVDCVNKTAPVVETPTPFKMIRTPNIKNGRVNTDQCRYVEQDTFTKWSRRGEVKRGDVLLTREAPLGEVGMVNTDENVFLGQRIMMYRANKDLVNEHFLLYSFLSADLQHQFSVHEGSGSVVSHIRVGDCLKFELNLPSLSEQRRIASVLASIDNKIELNQQTNQTLEKMAQTLFKSWFVDFDPVFDNALAKADFNLEALPSAWPAALVQRATLRLQVLQDNPTLKAKLTQHNLAETESNTAPVQTSQAENTHQHFPSEFEPTDEPSIGINGWIPKGWGVSVLGDMVTVKRGGSPRPIKDFIDTKGLPWTKISDATASQSRFIKKTKEFIKPEGLSKTSLLKKGSLILSNSATPGLPKFLDIDACIHDGWLHFPAKDVFSDLYLYQLFLVVRKELVQQGNGSVFTNLKTDILKNHNLIVPSEDILANFELFITPINNQMHAISENIEVLTKLRDTLLPKLISGELQIPDSLDVMENDD